MASFDLNEMPALDEDVPTGVNNMLYVLIPDDANPAGVDKLLNEAGEKRRSDIAMDEEEIVALETMMTIKANEKIGQGRNAMGEGNIAPFTGRNQACEPAQLHQSLYGQRNPVHYVISRRADATSEYAWRSWLPPKNAYRGGATLQSSEWVSLPSIFTRRKIARPGLANPAPGRGKTPDVSSAFSDPARAWSPGSVQQAKPSELLTDGAANPDGSDKHGSCRPEFDDDHEMVNSGMDNSSSKDKITEDGVPVLVENAPIHEKAGLAPKHSNVDHGKGQTALGVDDILGAELLHHLMQQERKKKREADFLASFPFGTELCNPTAPCKNCLAYFRTPVPKSLLKPRLSFQGIFSHRNHPPLLQNMDVEEMAQRKESRHGPKSMSSEFRGVTFYKRTQRWESHVWHRGNQVYLGASATKEEAARSYDKAALMMHGLNVDINYKLTDYQMELDHIYKLNKKQLVMYLRRDSRGLKAQAAYPGVKHVKNRYQAVFKGILWGTFPTMEEAARKIYGLALENGSGKLAAKIINTHHVRNVPSFASEYFFAVYPEEAEVLCQPKKRTRSRAAKKQQPSNPTPAVQKLPAPVQKLPEPVQKLPEPVQNLPVRRKNLNGTVRVAAKRTRHA